MFRLAIALIGVLLAVFVYCAFYPTTSSFAVEYTIHQKPLDVFYFVKNPYMLLDTCYSVKVVNVTSCDVAEENGTEQCQVSAMQDFAHVGQQTVHISIRSYASNLTIHSHMLIFHGVIAADWIYTFKHGENAVNESGNTTQISELCSIISPRMLHKYANRSIYETHLSILTNIESAMLLSVSSSEYT